MPATPPLPAHLPDHFRTATAAALSAPFRCGGEAAGLPQRIKILNWGSNPVRPGNTKTILVDDGVAASLAANQDLVGIDMVPMDYEHQSHRGHRNYKADPRHSPGSGTIEVVAGEGVFLCGIQYTPNGVEHAASYRDVSAVVHHDKDGRPLWISSVALTQTGAVAGVEFSDAGPAGSAPVAASLPLSAPLPTSTPLSTPPLMENTPDEPKFRELLILLLGLKPTTTGDVTDEEIIAAVNKKADAEPDGDEITEGTEALSARVIRLETAENRRERDALVARAGQEGKVIPLSAELIEQTPVAILSAMIDGLTAGEVPMATPQQAQSTNLQAAALSVEEAAAAKALGLTEQEFRHANPKD